MTHLTYFQDKIDQLKAQSQYRHFRSISSQPKFWMNGREMQNFASNDYLGLAHNLHLREEFFDLTPIAERCMSSSSSRLLTGNFPSYEQLEQTMSDAFGRSVLLLNSGYHMNIGILPALSDRQTVILADKWVHASLIDGIRLSSAHYQRYRHQDFVHLEQLLQIYQADPKIDRIVIVTESIFSMDGDETDLITLVRLKQQYPKVLLYVDEAHAVGVRGQHGLGCAEQYQVMEHIDFLVGTFGKALASVGAYVVCHPIIREYLINHMRSLIFSTAQAPICMAWTNFIFKKVFMMQVERAALAEKSDFLIQGVQQLGYPSPSSSHIVPVILGDAERSLTFANRMQDAGFYLLAVRPPTVPANSARLRICVNNSVQLTDLEHLLVVLKHG